MDDATLASLLEEPGREVYVLYLSGTPAGYAELDRGSPDDVEVCYFGLLPEFIGRGLGPYLLDWTIRRAWLPPHGDGAERVWLHTCTLDHPKALATYQRAGFQVYDQATVIIDDPRLGMDFGNGIGS